LPIALSYILITYHFAILALDTQSTPIQLLNADSLEKIIRELLAKLVDFNLAAAICVAAAVQPKRRRFVDELSQDSFAHEGGVILVFFLDGAALGLKDVILSDDGRFLPFVFRDPRFG
jgi:hypothetical protein